MNRVSEKPSLDKGGAQEKGGYLWNNAQCAEQRNSLKNCTP